MSRAGWKPFFLGCFFFRRNLIVVWAIDSFVNCDGLPANHQFPSSETFVIDAAANPPNEAQSHQYLFFVDLIFLSFDCNKKIFISIKPSIKDGKRRSVIKDRLTVFENPSEVLWTFQRNKKVEYRRFASYWKF